MLLEVQLCLSEWDELLKNKNLGTTVATSVKGWDSLINCDMTLLLPTNNLEEFLRLPKNKVLVDLYF